MFNSVIIKNIIIILICIGLLQSCSNNTDSFQDIDNNQITALDNNDNTIIIVGAKFKNPKTENIYWKGIDFLNSNEKNQALIQFQLALKLEPKNLTILEAIANLTGEKELYTEAISLYKEIIEIDSNRVSSILNLGLTYYLNNQFENAINQFNLVINKSTENYQILIAHYHKSEIYLNLKDCINAIENIEKAESIDVNSNFQEKIIDLKKDISETCK